MEFTSAVQKFHASTRQVAGRGRGAAQPQKKRTAKPATDGFLKSRFRPFWAVQDKNYRQVEAEFLRSLANLCEWYAMPFPDVAAMAFPQNVQTAYLQVKEGLKKVEKEAECIIIRDENHRATLAVLKTFDTGRNLYYIPVNPVWQLVQADESQPLAEMLLSVYSYLYQIAKVPYYTDHGSYLYYQYDFIQHWIDEADDDSEEEQQYRDEQNEVDLLNYAGDRLASIIRRPYFVAAWESNIATYRRSDDCNERAAELAEQFLILFRQYPGRSLFDNIHENLIVPGETERVRVEQYISFYWSGNDCLYDLLNEMVNNDLQECGIVDEPTAIQLFDTPQAQTPDGLEFERRLFDLIDELCELVNEYDHD